MLRRLFPFPSAGAATTSILEVLNELVAELRSRALAPPAPERPAVLLNMASSADGRATIDGRSGPIGDRADSELLHGLRTICDALLVGAGTARAERYARLLRGQDDRDARRRRGLQADLLTCIVSRSLDLGPQTVPLLAEQDAEVVILTPSAGELPASAARVGYVRCEREGQLDLGAALSRLRSDHGVARLLCEGGPHLAAQLLSAGLVDELFLSLAPKLGGGEEHLRILAGTELDPPLEMRLVSVLEHESSLFLRYRLD